MERSDRVAKLLTRIVDIESPMMWRIEVRSDPTLLKPACLLTGGKEGAEGCIHRVLYSLVHLRGYACLRMAFRGQATDLQAKPGIS